MKFDYFICTKCNVIVEDKNVQEHYSHGILGTMFKIKHAKKKLTQGLISRKLINSEKDKLSIIKFNARSEKEKKQKILAQQRFAKQIPDGDVIVNLLELKI